MVGGRLGDWGWVLISVWVHDWLTLYHAAIFAWIKAGAGGAYSGSGLTSWQQAKRSMRVTYCKREQLIE